MAIHFDHTIVRSVDPARSATFLASVLDRPKPVRYGIFHVVSLDNAVSLDFTHLDAPFEAQHYAFLIEESEFDRIFTRLRERDVVYWADPAHRYRGEINHHDGGRGIYFDDPDGHVLELITRPYGGGGVR